MKYFVISLIRLYQKSLSPDHGWFRARYPYGFCRFYPSCSEFTAQSIANHGVAKGLWLGTKRIVRCNPFTRPQVDRPAPR